MKVKGFIPVLLLAGLLGCLNALPLSAQTQNQKQKPPSSQTVPATEPSRPR
jgi:hypothetical protein